MSRKILFKLAENRIQLRELVLAVPENAELFAMSANYEALGKIILWNSDDQKLQLRLHIYSDRGNKSLSSPQVDIAKAHNHRWNFSSMILSGGYRHSTYMLDHDGNDSSIKGLIPVMIRNEIVGDCYTLHHTQYHSVAEEPNTVSLIMRGPLEKERFQVIKEENGRLCQQDAPSLETSEEKNQKKMSEEKYYNLVDKLTRLNIIYYPS